jgi:hypothetical protein
MDTVAGICISQAWNPDLNSHKTSGGEKEKRF